MSGEPHVEVQNPIGQWCARSRRIADFVERRLADARAHAERGRLVEANERLLELRTGLVGRSPGDRAGLLRDAPASFRGRSTATHPSVLEPSLGRDASARPAVGETQTGSAPTGGRNDWLEAIQLTAQAISHLTAISAASKAPTPPETRSAALAAWEARHRDRIGRWAQRATAGSQAPSHETVGPGGVETGCGLDGGTEVSTDPPTSYRAVHDVTTHGHVAEDGTIRPPGSSRPERSP